MKNKKRYLVTAVLFLIALSLAACDGVSGGVSIDELTAALASSEIELDEDNSLADDQGRNDLVSSVTSSSSQLSGAAADDELKFKGTVEGVTENTISFNGETFTVDIMEDLTTLFTNGASYEIEYRLNEEGVLSLLEFHLEDNNSSETYFKFNGMVDDVIGNKISFGGATFTVDTLEDLTALFEIGAIYEIKYLVNGDGTISLLEFHLEEDDSFETYFKFNGVVDDITGNTISFGGATFTIDTQENLATIFETDAFYEIKFLINEDGTISLLEFHFEDSGTDDDMDDDIGNGMDDDLEDDSSNDDNHDNDDYNDDYDDDDNDNSSDDNNDDDNDDNDDDDNSKDDNND